MYNAIDYLPGALDDIEGLQSNDPGALAVVLAFLEEAETDPRLIDKFTTYGEVNIGQYLANAKPWQQARASDNLFRIRILNTQATSYRVVYGFDWRQRRIGVLAIVHKEHFDYGIKSVLADRIFNDWHFATAGQPT